jgi:quinol-cytochrome oxidoreductase complex cytochrome b subunit
MKNIEFIICVVLTVVTAFVIAIWVPTPDHDPMKKVQLAMAYGMLVLLILFGFLVLAAIATGKIDISLLLAEVGGGASMSRFQLLIFTFVIALSLFLVVICKCEFPKIPTEVLMLLGISATTYGVSKGIQAGATSQGKNASTSPQPAPPVQP